MELNRKFFRSIKRNLSFVITASVLTALAVAVMISAIATGLTLMDVMREFLLDYKSEDAQFYTMLEIPEDDLERLNQEYDVVLEEQRYLDVDYDGATIRVMSAMENVDLYQVTKGEDLSEDNDILLTTRFARTHDIAIGDCIVLNETEYRVCGYCIRADYSYMLNSLSDTYKDDEKFGLGVVKKDVAENISNANFYYSVIYNENAEETKFRKVLYEDYFTIEYITAENNSRISFANKEGEELLSTFILYCPLVFLIVVAVIAVVLGRIIKREQVDVGTLTALGLCKREIMNHYVLYGIFPGVLGSILGGLASIPFTNVFAEFYFMDFEVIPYQAGAPAGFVVAVLLAPVIVYWLASYLIIYRQLNEDVVKMLRGEAGKKRARHILTKSRMDFKWVYMLRVACNNISRSVAVILGLWAACFCVLLGGIMYDSINDVLHRKIDEMAKCEYEYIFSGFQTENPYGGEPIIDVSYEVEGYTRLFNIVGYEQGNKMLNLDTLSGAPVEYDKYYMTNAAAKNYGISAGDTFTFRNTVSLEEYTVEIADILDDDIIVAVYSSKENAAKIVGIDSNQFNVILSNDKLDIDDSLIRGTNTKEKMRENFMTILNPMYTVIYIFLLVGVLFCILIISMISNMILEENARNISMLTVLGYRTGETRRLVLSANHLLVPLSFLIAIPVTKAFTVLMLSDAVEQFGLYIDVIISPVTLLACLLLVVVTYIITLLASGRKISKIDMVEGLKSGRE